MFSDIEAFTRRFGKVRPHLSDSGFALAIASVISNSSMEEATSDDYFSSANYEVTDSPGH